MNEIKKFIMHMLTGIDGETYAVSRVLWVLGALVFLGLTIFVVIHTGTFNFTEFGLALASILGGGGAGVKLTETTEPKEPKE